MRIRSIILLCFSLILGIYNISAQVSVQIVNPVLEPGESTQVVIEVDGLDAGCEVRIYGVNTTTLVHFRDTTVRIPMDWSDGVPFVFVLPVHALPNIIAVWGEYLIVAEIQGSEIPREIIALSPGQPCSGNVPTGGASADMTFQWETTGDFTAFEIVFYENPCGKDPGTPSTPTTPTTTTPTPTTTTPTTPSGPSTPSTPPSPDAPTSPTTPSVPTTPSGPSGPTDPSPDAPGDVGDTDFPSGDGSLPALPPGWEWGPNGPYWTGEHPPEPPALPPGWEWGPLRPHWVGQGQPSTAGIVFTCPIIPATGSETHTAYSTVVNVSAFLNPGDAFVYQIYGMAENSDGSETGVLSETMCDRYSPMISDTEIPVEDTPCPSAGCTVSTSWVKKTPITVTRPLDHYPKGEELKEMIPGTCISFSLLAKDLDLLKQVCQGDAKCENEEPAIKRIGPLEHGIQYKWTLNGEGALQEVCENTIFYQTPKTFKKEEKKTVNIDIELSNVAGKIADDPIQGSIKLTMTFIDSCKCIDTEVEIQQPREKTYNEDFTEKQAVCNPKDPVWKKGSEIAGTLTVKKELCPESLTILKADYKDSDELTVTCIATECGVDETTLSLNDPLTYTWDDNGAGGSFPLGSAGPCVLYKAPAEVKSVTFRLKVKDSGTQFTDNEKNDTDQGEVKQLLDLTEINVEGRNKYTNITVGHQHKFIPVWEPNGAIVKKIVWELDLGGANGKVRKVLCDPDGLSKAEATLNFTTKDKEEGLEISWKLRSHIHGTKELKCKIYGSAGGCQDCCLCEDDAWDESDFLGRDPLAITQFNLFFEKEDFEDDGKIENLTTVRDYDEFGEKTSIHGENAINWFTHWSKATYGTCQHDHTLTDPIVRYRDNSSWLGLYEPDRVRVSLAKKAARSQDRDQWTGNRWVESSDLKYIDARLKTQRAYDLKGHNLANKVFLHEMGHFTSMTKNWRAGEVWHTAYGARTKDDISKGKTKVSASNQYEVTVVRTGNYNGRKGDGIDIVQKFNITITLYTGNGQNRRVLKTVDLTDAWFVSSATFQWTNRARTEGKMTSSTFEIRTVDKNYVFRSLELNEFDRANDPDEDYIPNREEDRIGTCWRLNLTHSNHARGKATTSDGHKQLPDQEFWADQYMFDRYNLVEPGNPDKDWANPGSQTDPEYDD